MSRKVVFPIFGEPDILEILDVDIPVPSPDQVLVRIKAAGIQPFDARFRAGAFGAYVPAHFPQGLGNEFAGVIQDVGVNVTEFAPGDDVIGFVWANAYADHVLVGADEMVRKPANMPWAEAGALSASGQTAHTALEELGVGKDDTLLVHAAAGGVGTFAVQLARALGANVIGTSREANHAYLRALGAIPVTYGDGLVERVRAAAPQGIDAALDAHGGHEAIRASVELVPDRSRIGTLSGHETAASYGVKVIGTERSKERLAGLVKLYEQGKLKVFVRKQFPLDKVAEAHREVETGHGRGKLLLITG